MDDEESSSTRRALLRSAALTTPAVFSGLAGCEWVSESGNGPNMTEPSTGTATTPTAASPGADSLPDPLSADGSNPLVFLDDQLLDSYMGELALGMADSGTAPLNGFLVGYPREVYKDEGPYERQRQLSTSNLRETRRVATQSGLENLPPAELGVFEQHQKPSSEAIEDTEPIGSVGTDRLVATARAATPDNPAVVAAGGDLCTVADAYLTDPSIADSLVVYWHEQVADINDQSGYNIRNSGWSAYIVLKRLAVALNHSSGGFTITTEEVDERIPSPLDQYMMTKEHWNWGNPLTSSEFSEQGSHGAHDEKALTLAVFPNTRLETRRMTVTGLQASDWDYETEMIMPTLGPGPADSNLVHITDISESDRPFWSAWK